MVTAGDLWYSGFINFPGSGGRNMNRLSVALIVMGVMTLLTVPVCAISEFFGGEVKNIFEVLFMAFVLFAFARFLERFRKK